MSELDDFVESNTEEVAAVEPVEVTKDVVEVEEGETTAPEVEANEPEKVAAEPEEAKEPDESWTKTAVLDERKKRQALEQELASLKAGKGENIEPQERPDVFDDPEAAFKHTESAIDRKLLDQKISMSVEMVKAAHDDYDELESEFIDIVKDSPDLIQKMNSHPMPAKFVRETALRVRNLKEVDNVPVYQDKIAKLEAELAAFKTGKTTPTVPKSLTSKGSKIDAKTTEYGSIDDELAGILGS